MHRKLVRVELSAAAAFIDSEFGDYRSYGPENTEGTDQHLSGLSRGRVFSARSRNRRRHAGFELFRP